MLNNTHYEQHTIMAILLVNPVWQNRHIHMHKVMLNYHTNALSLLIVTR